MQSSEARALVTEIQDRRKQQFGRIAMETARERAQRRHVREKATIDHLVRDVYEPKTPDEKHSESRPTTSTGLPVEDQVPRNDFLAIKARSRP
jgi:hypothetical protein